MHLMYFTEQPMSAYDAKAGLDFGATALMFPNSHFDPVAGSRLYNEYLEHYILADELGIDGIMLNEHHNAPFCMQARANIFASVAGRRHEKRQDRHARQSAAAWDNPVQLAEELSMIDMLSKGRLVSGFVRGGGQEQLAGGINPAFNRERFEEAHDLIVKTWTQPGPFRWEGTHYQQRVVNPWTVPLQKPHPHIWIPGVISKETIVWAAQHGYPYIALNTPVERTRQIWDIYDAAAAEAGFQGGPAYHGLLKQIHVAETEEKAIENARQFMWMQGEFTGLAHPVWSTPAGLRQPGQPPRLRRIRHRPVQEPALPPGGGEADGGTDDHRRHAEAGDRQAAHPAGGDAAGHPVVLGQRRHRLARGRQDLHPPARHRGVPGRARDGEGVRPEEPVRDRAAGQHEIHAGDGGGAEGGGGVARRGVIVGPGSRAQHFDAINPAAMTRWDRPPDGRPVTP